MIKKILLLASLFFTLISFSQKIDASLEHLREGESVMMERAMPLPLGQRPSGFTQSDINKNSAEKDLTLRGNMTFIGNSNLNRNLKKTREYWQNIDRDNVVVRRSAQGLQLYNLDDEPNTSYDSLDLLIYNLRTGGAYSLTGNGQFYMDYVDIDGYIDENGDRKDDTFSSSSATLNLPNTNTKCSRVAYAGLYWAGVYPSEFWGNATPRSNDYDKIKFKYPSSTAYKNITADEIIYNVNEPYICFKDITTEVQAEANPNGVYTAANIRAIRGFANGLGGASGWVMIVIYENDNESSKKFSVFDGFAAVRDGSPQEVKFTGFKTIPKGPVNVELIMATLEGDSNITGDDYQIKNAADNYVNVFNTISPQDNFFNGSISVFDTYLAGRNPASTNTLGFDVDHIKINNTGNSIIGNNETEAEVKFTSVGDVYWPFLNAISVEVVKPEIKLVKTAVDATNTPITSEVALGGDVYYNITFQNIGTDNAKNTVIVDELKTTVDFEDVLGNVEVSDSRITYIYEASTVLNGGGGKLTFNIPDDLVKVNGAEHSIKIKVNATTDCSKLRDACANKVKNQAVATYERDESKLSSSNPGYVQGYNTLTTLSYAGLEPSCNLGIKGTTNFTIDTSKCKGSTQVLCGRDTELSAGAGFDSYEWVNTANPAIVLATTQNYKATKVGTYQVTSIAPNGCTDKTEIINIVGSNLATNPLKPFVNQVLPICNGFELSEIYLCGTADFREIILPFGASLATEVKWSKLDETKPCDATKPTELPSTNNCANIGTKCSWDEIGTKTGRELSKKFDKKGQYKLEVLYDGQCPATYYFNVFSGALNPKFDKKNIVCGANGSIIVNGVPSGYEYKLTAPSGNTIPVNGFQNNNEFKNLSEVGNYDITIKLKGSTLASCSFDYIVKIDEQVLDLTVAPEFTTSCDGKAIITAQVNGTLPGDYIYTLLNSVGGVIETKVATPDRSVTFEVTNAGVYSVKVATTTTTCTDRTKTRVIKPAQLTLTAVATKNITCTAGSSAGIITLAGANGVPNATGDKYSYALLSIDGAAVSPKTYFTDTTYDVVNGTEGDYIFEVTDSKNCTATATAKISVEAPLQFTHTETQVNCNKKGTITVDVTNNTGYKLEYSLDNANWQLLNTFDTLDVTTAATLYTVYIRATKGTYQCNYQIQNIAITETGGLSAGKAVATGLECRWGNTQSSPIGTITFTQPTGGTAPFTYFYKLASDTNFTSVTSGNTVSVPVAGTYNTKVEDKNGCSLALDTVTIDALPTEPTIKHEILICGNTATVIITPKDASYSYSIDGTNFQASNVFENVRQDWYKFSIKYGKSCTVKTPYVSLYGQPLTGSVTATTDSDCSGSDNGSITVNARNFQGGSYEYSTDGGNTWEETGDNPYRIVGLAKGDYDLKIRETIGTAPNQITCEKDLGKHSIGEPTELKLINTGITTPATCVTGATITVEATGGTPPYKFSIDGGTSWQDANSSNQYIYTGVAVSAKKYQVMLLDSKKCDECGCTDNPFENGSFEDRYFTGYYPYIADESNFTGWETTAADNEMELWYKNNFQGVPSYDGSDHFVELNANTVGSLYQEFCTKPGDEINWSVAHRGRLGRDVATVKIGKSLATATIEETMSDGKTWKEYSGTYTVPAGQTTTVISFDAVSTFTKDKSTGNFIDAVKIEIVRATCVLKDIEVTAAAAATHTATVTDSCTDPKIEITATGIPPYQFTIDNGATWQTSNNATFVFNTTNGLALPTTTAKDYQVKTKNGGGCISLVSTLTVYPKLEIKTAKTPKTCTKDATITITASGGDTNYVYEISPSAGTTITGNKITVTDVGVSYTVKVKDNNGTGDFCTVEEIVPITEIKSPIITNITATALDCTVNTKASISFEVSEGKAPFSYTVHDGTSTIKTGNITGNTATISGLTANTYKIIVTDANNCVSAEISEKIKALAGLTDGSAVATNLKCSTSGTVFGTITFTNPTTGTPDLAGNYTFYYKLNGTPVTAFQPVVGNSKTGLPAGTYNTKVVDSKGCEKDLETVTIKPLPTVLTTIKPVTYNCNGKGNVKVTVTTTPIATATAPITYTLGADTNETGEFTKLSVGNHTVSVNYGSDCILPVIVEVKAGQNFTAVASSVENPKCKDGTDGKIKVVASFGSVAVNSFEYSTDGTTWIPVASNEVIIDTFGEGTHIIEVRQNLGGCEVDSNAIKLTAPTSAVIVNPSTKTLTKEITCTLPTGATIIPSASGGNGTYTFELLDSAKASLGNTFTDLSAGTYYVVATDKLGCKSDSFEIEIKAPKTVTFTATASVCHTGNDAKIELTGITGNDANFTFSVHDGTSIIRTGSITGIAQTISGLSAGTYKVTVTDGFGCSETEDVTIKPQLTVSATTTQQTCNPGDLTITASGGSGVNYVYAVVTSGAGVPADTSFSVTAPTEITAGTWDIYVRDNNGTGTLGTDYCQAFTTNKVTKIPDLKVETVTAIQPKCSTDKGTINVTVSGGTTDYTVTLTGSGATPTVKTATGSVLNYQFTGLDADTYTITVEDINACTGTAASTQEIKVPSALKDGKAAPTDLACGVSGGSITFTNPTGGTPDPVTGNYTFYYKLTTDANFTPVLGNNTNTVTVTNLSAGDYLTKVVDSEGCSLDLNTVTNPITIKALPAVPTFDPTTITYNCDGTATIKVTPTVAAAMAYSYMLDKDKTTTNNTGVFTAVAPGSHTVSVDYGSNCSTDIIVEVKANQQFTASITGQTNPVCKDDKNGKIEVTASFGSVAVTEFQYSIDGVFPTTWITVNSNKVTIDGFNAGTTDITHTINVRPTGKTSPSACDVTLTKILTNPTEVKVTKATATQITCTSTTSTITPTASGGNGAVYTFELLNSAKASYSPVKTTTTTFTNVAAGTHYVVAKDKENCPSAPFEVTIDDKKDVEFTATASACHTGSDASITLDVTKGNGTYSFALTGTATKIGNITGTSHTIPNLSAGTYTVTVTDGFGCELEVKDIIINAKITATLNTTQETCKDGTLTIASVAGASGANYVYAVVTENTAPTTFTAITNPLLTTVSLSEGKYDVYIRDNSGNAGYCQYKETKEITKIPDLTATAKTPIQPKCNGETGSLVFEISGGKATYTYTLNGAAVPATATVTVVGNTHTIAGLVADDYDIIVKDANTCTVTIPTQTIKAPDKLEKVGDATPIHFTCKTTKGGIDFVSVNPKGGTGVYTYSYKLTTAANYTSLLAGITSVSNLDEGTYNIKVKDVNNCEITLNDVTINPLPAEPTFDVPVITYNCEGKGSFTITPFDTSYTYSLDGATPQTGANPNVFADLDAGSYTVSVGYGSDCFTDIDVIVAVNQEFTASITGQTNPVCKDKTNGKIEVTASFPSVTPTSFEYSTDNGTNWNTATINPFIIDGFNGGTHTIKVRPTGETSTACDVTLTKTLSNPTAVVVSLLTKVTKEITCDPATGATITLFAGGGNGTPYTFELFKAGLLQATTVAGVNTFTNISEGDYTIKAKDSESCESVAFSIEVKAKIDVDFDIAALCYDGTNGTINVTNILGNGALKYTQNGGTTLNAIPAGATSFTVIGLSPGVHKIKIIDERGCSLEKTITIYPELSATATPTNLSCTPAGNPTGQILVVPSGGTGFVTPTDYQFSVVTANTTAPLAGTYSATNPITGLAAGTYDVYVKDAQNCEYIVEDILIKTITPVKITTIANQPQCNGNKGSIDGKITANTGQAPFTITLKDSAGITVGTTLETLTITGTTFSFNNLVDETYTIEITDALGCKFTKTETITSPIALVIDIKDVLPTDCVDTDPAKIGFDFENVNAAVYLPNKLQYTIDNGATWIDYTDGKVRGLNSGELVYIGLQTINTSTNAVVCSIFKGVSYEISYNLSGLIVNPVANPLNCSTGFSVTVEADGGNSPFEFAIGTPTNWLLADTTSPASVPPTIPAIPQIRTRTFDGLIQGLTYEFFVKDALNCIKKNSDSVYVDFTPTVLIKPTINKKSCFTTIPNTGTGQITFDIDNKSTHLDVTFDWIIYKRLTPATKALITDPIIAQSPAGGETSLTITSPADLEAGTYYILLSNRTGTPACQFGSLDVEIEQGTEIKGNLKNIKDITCALPGKIRIEGVNGGFGGYIYTATATEGATTTINGDIVSVSYPTTTPIPATVDVTVTVTDKNGCGITLTETLKVSKNPTINPVTVNSCGAVNTIAINTTSGLAPYQYSLDGINFQTPVSTANHTINVSDGLGQTLTVKDANGCADTVNFDVYPDITFDIDNITVPSCDTSNNSANNATATITVNTGSGSGNYQYSLDSGTAVVFAGTSVILPANLNTGNHTIEIFDTANNCSLKKTFTVSEPIKPSFTHTFTDSKCATDNSGTITLTSTEALTYTINPDPNSAGIITTNKFTGLPLNTYTVTATGTNGCTTEIKDIIITEFKAITVPTPTVTEFACTTGNTRNSAIVKVDKTAITEGSETYTKAEFVFTPYLADGITLGTPEPAIDSNTFEFTTDNILGGKVDITVYDDKGCSGTTTAIIASFTPIADLLATQKTPITCSVNESIKVEFTGIATEIKVEQIPTIGTGYTQTPATASASGTEFADLPVGKYTITIKNDKGCELTTYHTVTAIPAYTILLSDKIDTSCINSSTGSIKFDVDGYVGDYDYTIVDKSTGIGLTPAKTGTNVSGIQSISNLLKGNYTVNITIGAGTNPQNCTVTPIDFEIIDAPDGELKVKAEETSAVKCKDEANATITVTETKGGWGRYEYQLEIKDAIGTNYTVVKDALSNDINFTTNGNNKIFTGLAHGTYKVKVKDALGCISEDTIIIKNPTEVKFTVTKDDTVCDANIAGSITVDLKDAVSGLAGGKAPYTYTLTDDASTPNVKTVTITDTEYTFTGLSKANYTVSVKDANLCDGTVTGSTNTVEIFDDIVFNEPTLVTELKCQTGTGVSPNTNTNAVYNINVSGGSGNFTYLVTEKDDTSKVITVTPATLTTPPTFKTSVAEEYTITITDIGATPNCTKTSKFTVKESVKPKFTATPSDKICNGTATGVITINETVKVGINPVTYTISPNNGTFDDTNGIKTFKGLKALKPGDYYTITATGDNGCTSTQTETITETLEVKIEANAISDIAYSCTNPMATIKVDKNELSGGSGNYNVAFVYDNGTPADTTDDVTQAVPNVFKFTTTNTSGGKVKIIVSDDQGCSSTEEEVTIPAFAPIGDLKVTQKTPITCSVNESIKVIFTGTINKITVTQTGVLTGGYVQNPASPVLTSPIEFTDLPTGNYTISVTDAVTGCEATRFHTVSKIPVYDVVLSDKKDIACFNGKGSIEIDVKDYTGNYNYEVVDSVTGIGLTSAITGTNISAGTSEEITGLEAGKYKIKITLINSNDKNCSVNLSSEFEIIKPAIILGVTADVTTKISCTDDANATITATATGGWNSSYEYQLEDTSGTAITVKDKTGTDVIYNFANNKGNNIFENLPEGTYKVRVKDALGCDVESAEVIVENPTKVEFTVSKDDTICDNKIGGEITVTGSGGTGTYTYTLTDDSNPVKVTKETGATGAYTFTNLPAANYTVTVKDTNQCNGTVKISGNDTLEIFENIDFPTPTSTDLLTCVSTDEVTFNIVASGGSGTFTYGIVKNEASGDIEELATTTFTSPTIFKTSKAGTYTVTITDTGAIGNCLNPITRTFTVNEPAQPDFNPKATTNNICFDSSDGVIAVNEVFVAEVNPVTYTISLNGGTFENGTFDAVTKTFSALKLGTYIIKGTGDNGCSVTSKDVTIEQLDKVILNLLAVDIQNAITYNCDVANPTATITVDKTDIKGGTGNYNVEFVYDNGTPTDNTDDVTQIDSSTFTFTTTNVLGGIVEIKVTDDQGCDSDIKTVTIPAFAAILPSDIQISHTPTCEVGKQSITVKLDNLDPTIITPIKVEIEKPDGTIISKEIPRALANITGTVFNNLPVGIYTISIEDPVTGCVTTAQSYSVEAPVYNVLSSSIENTTCTGSETGSVVIDVQKGNSQEFYTGEYEYEVLDSVGNSLTPSPIKENVQAATGTTNPLKISGLKAGSYYVKITEIDNATACSFTSEVFTIEDAPIKLEVTADISSEITCTNDNNATITATATGGWGSNYEYQLEDNLGNTITVKDALGADVIYDFANNKGNNIFKNLPEGTYKVQVKDVLGCDNVYSKEQIIVNPKPVTFKTEMIANICSDTKPAIKVTAQGGSGEYIYTLKDSAGIEESITTTSLTHTFDNLSVDNNEDYTVSVNDVKGCIGTPETVNADVVTVYPDIALGLTPGKLTCIPGSENAEYIINVTGGSGDFSYSVVDKNDATNIVAVIKTTNPPTFSIADAGTYILKITDNKAEITCNSIESEDIVVDDKLVPAFEPQILVNNICNGSSTGEVLVKETPNGINPLEYSINTNPIITLPIGEFKFTGLSAGTYTITGKGTNDCTATKDVTIVEKTKITLDIVEIQNSVVEFSCTTGNQTNMATVTVTDAINGGTVPGGVQNINRIVFVYDNGTPLDATDDIEQDENDLIFNIVNNNNDIKAGTVTITVYDAQNCSSATGTVTIDAFQKIGDAEIKITQKLDCTNKEIITVKANHDIANPNIANLIYTIKGTNTAYDEQETIVSATGSATFTGLDTDAYTITITNPITGCVFTTSHTVKDEPTFNIKIGGNKRTCFDAAANTATATVTLDIETIIAAADYTDAYTYEVVDAITESSLTAPITGNGTGGVQNMISGLIAGTYKVKVTMTDAPGCDVLSDEFTINEPPTKPELTLDDSIVTFISCNSGEGGIILKADGGWGNYQYQLEETTTNTIKQPFGENGKFEELEEGSYTATVRDINNCEATFDFVLVKGVKLIVDTPKVTQNVCEGEKNASIEVNVIGGGQTQDTSIRTYSYILKYPTELGGLELEQTSNIFTGLQAGNYQIRVIDNKYGCTTGKLENVEVEIKDPNKVIISSVNITKDITCNIPTASVEVTAGGGKAPYEFSTDGITYTASASTTYTFTGLNPGLNTFYVKDTEQCVTTTTATIAEYVDLEATLNVVSGFITCKNDSNGVLSATVTGGFGNYEYQLLAGNGVAITGVWQTSNTFSGLTPATYKIKVRSTNRFGKVCEMETIKDHEIKEPEVLEPFIKSVEHVTCNGGSTGVITASATGGTKHYEYNIVSDPGSLEYPANKFVQDGEFTNLKAGTYYVTVKDVRGCTQAAIEVTVKQPNNIDITAVAITQQVCIYDATPTITVNVTGGTQPYYISINNDELLVPYSLNQITLGKDEGIEAGKKYSISVRGKDEGCSVATLAIQETTAAISLDVEAFSNYTCDSGNFIKAFVADKYKDDVIFTLDNGINTPLTNTTGEFIDVTPGDGYKVTATHTASICTETSTDEFDIQDIQALAMTIDDSEKNKLIANVNFGLPPYNFTLDGVDYGQDNEFTILQTKEYEIKVTDARGCEVILLVTGRYVSISVLNLFTPDGDGINDFWYPLEVENYHNIKVYIYDRYARKIQNYQGLTQGWDGTYQGKPLPAGDYWYTIYYNELSGEEKKLMGHFTLYR
ncbi:T9SS type B sorting domain-containing protein [Tenacibaculum finnmarkense]|uniref:T9SS type B sorting domain-containing protein n=2 Tax=Tenacibaculum finnmarkense TaxID=2781243 RepID=UPI001EFC03AB|nr:T9SS type B sorting domain-containing protein [Tenacibaculum finnmarkense]MCG8842550.1 T9SS type B sorting domain-containing protein [Tenacibaculum finnmarkense]MCG8866707.1 T9SS type B sorting domain-containing protein [Tenacibaculum finnmarkense]MCG8876671.1 T9SS type B sorting domain-containing protein [Tenacibaculum finnmarkense]MCG8895329.1 T9SS type B sorting domain-containing protein [Tenacibaculum finnmarkense]